ncbi:hypothetical protein IMZ31_24280 (plasmid) [Pontibacillus sp. ALD_SL1]|uniref:hypothetical protein n=1 Tax=Pontibacillus sp. ALD_SL1 TaxID=2777185 RepID=UPI001A9579EB|nr:hypothetical protein [Pontibacillus sp. ALD_SL1]QST02571.1 hypothetical protein IMZ31_24280 [Pontibacillus sp. ALD_SL1]
MKRSYIIFNIALIPIYVLFLCIFVFGLALTGSREWFWPQLLAVIPQFMLPFVGLNVINCYKQRGKDGNMRMFWTIVALMPIPFVVVALLMRIFYL